jgi:hypothetical protein
MAGPLLLPHYILPPRTNRAFKRRELERVRYIDGEIIWGNGAAHVPTPMEIRIACRKVQMEWSELDRIRAGGGLLGFRTPPRIRTARFDGGGFSERQRIAATKVWLSDESYGH